MAEYIKKEYAYFAAVLIASLSIDHKITCDEIQKIMNSIPNADVIEREKDKWDTMSIDDDIAHCTLLKYSKYGGLSAHPTNFCRDRGADMKEES